MREYAIFADRKPLMILFLTAPDPHKRPLKDMQKAASYKSRDPFLHIMQTAQEYTGMNKQGNIHTKQTQ